jgi:hypothetical protein
VPPFTSTLSHDPDQLRGLRHALASWFESDGVPDHCRNSIVLATHEAAANAIRHGEIDRPVNVTVTHEVEGLTVTVENDPRWRAATGPSGLTMMRDLMSEVGSTTTVRMRSDL